MNIPISVGIHLILDGESETLTKFRGFAVHDYHTE